MDAREQLRRLGVPEDLIDQATVNGQPLTEAEKPRETKRPPLKHDLADAFCELWRRMGPDLPLEREHRFHPTRKWRFDVAWPERRVAVELEGGVWTRGRHTRGAGYRRDMEKYNTAAAMGWTILRFAVNDLDYDPLGVVEQVSRALEGPKDGG